MSSMNLPNTVITCSSIAIFSIPFTWGAWQYAWKPHEYQWLAYIRRWYHDWQNCQVADSLTSDDVRVRF